MKHLPILLLTLLFALSTEAQSFTLDPSASSLTISGTSSLHDWEMEAEDMSGSADISVSGEQVSLSNLTFIVPVSALKSGKGAMDKNAVKALKGSDHPNIKYTAASVNGASGNLTASGYLELAGERKPVTVIAKPSVSGSNLVGFEGTVDMKMTDFGIDPPRALLGTLKTGDEIVIHFNLKYKTN